MAAKRLGAWAFAAALSFAASAEATDVDTTAVTLLGGRPDIVDGQVRTVVPLTELVGLRVTAIDNPVVEDLHLALSAWGGFDDLNASAIAGDVDVAFVEGRLLKKALWLRVGRQLVIGGAARASYVDGLQLAYALPHGVQVSAFAGVPVARRFYNLPSGGLATGARASWSPRYGTEVGLSMFYGGERGTLTRLDAGADARWTVRDGIVINGLAVFSLAESRLAELDIGPRWQVLPAVELSAAYRRMAPDLLLPRDSILTVFADSSRDDVGAKVAYQLSDKLGLLADYRYLWQEGENGHDAGVRAMYRLDREGSTVLTAQARVLELPDNGFWQARVAASQKFIRGLGLTADAEVYYLNNPINADRLSLSTSVTASWAFARKWTAGVTVFAATTPLYQSRFEAIAKLAYAFSAEGWGASHVARGAEPSEGPAAEGKAP